MSDRIQRHLGAVVRETVNQLRAQGSTAHASALTDAFIAAASKEALDEYCGVNLPRAKSTVTPSYINTVQDRFLDRE